MFRVLLDTDVFSEVLKGKHASAVAAAERYLEEHGRLTFSAITHYEVERGLLSKRAAKLLTRFDAIVAASELLPISLGVLKRAARIWALAARQGHPRNDADILVAATAIEHKLPLVTGNRRHFDWIADLQLEEWYR